MGDVKDEQPAVKDEPAPSQAAPILPSTPPDPFMEAGIEREAKRRKLLANVEEKLDDLEVVKLLDFLVGQRDKKPGSFSEMLPRVAKRRHLEELIFLAKDVFAVQPMCLELEPPVHIIGDLHGQFHDLLRIFQRGGFPPMMNYLFLGDYVDRGQTSIETMLTLYCYKLMFPDNFFILRGNHEAASICRIYGFWDECKRRYDPKLWKAFVHSFCYLPIAATVGDRIMCMHGGLSPKFFDLYPRRDGSPPSRAHPVELICGATERPCEVPDEGLICDILWSDPAPMLPDGTYPWVDWGPNERGVSFTFSPGVVEQFCAMYGFDLVARAHQVAEDGYEFFAGRKCVTVFSAPNYCGEFDNPAGILSVRQDMRCSFFVMQPVVPGNEPAGEKITL